MGFTRYGTGGRTEFEATVVFDKIKSKIRNKVKESFNNTLIDVESLLEKHVSHGNTYIKGQGISPFDNYRSKTDGRDRTDSGWRKTFRENSDTKKVVRFYNTARQAPYLFGQRRSSGAKYRGENANFRSARNHLYQVNPIKYKYEPNRPNQVTKVKWEAFKKYIREELKTNITGNIKGAFQ